MKNNKGITLIALVVTIIVLLILAGVSIAMLSGQNGILNRATWQSKLGDAESTVALSVSNFLTDYYAVKYTNADSEYTGSHKITGTDTEETALKKGLNKAQSELGDDYAVVYTPKTADAAGTIKIQYQTNGKIYEVTGTISGSNVTWGKMDKSVSTSLNDPKAPAI